MINRKFLAASTTAFSVFSAVAVLVVLLLVATARTPEQLRQIGAHANYLQQASGAVTRGIAVSLNQAQPMGADLEKLDVALAEGTLALEELISATYQPSSALALGRWSVMQGLNVIDSDAGELSDANRIVETALELDKSLVAMRKHLDTFGQAQAELLTVEQSFSEGSKKLIGFFRQQGQQDSADVVYVNTEQAKKLLRTGGTKDLDEVLALVDNLERLEAQLPTNERGQLRLLINATYTMISLKRAMNQAVVAVNEGPVNSQLETLSDLVTNDQLYVLSAVNDARVLLNVYTVLLLVVLGFFGLRLAASHRALNRSHDDLEERVQARTADLAQANENLKESQVQLVQAEKMSSLGQLVAGVMHEINTPLLYVLNNTSVTSEAVTELADFFAAAKPILTAKNSEEGKLAIKSLLARRGEFDMETLAENISEVQSLGQDSIEGLHQISDLVQSLKDFSRLDRMADDQFDVREGIEKTLTITRNLLKQGVRVHKHFAEVPPIFCSPSRLNQVFINIVTNAVQAMDGRGDLTITTSHNMTSQGDSVEIVFEDSGCGIAEEDLNKIMDPFFTTKPVGEGTGLGLSIVRQIVDQHAGQIYVDSKLGHGTRIVLSFPVEGPAGQVDETEEAA
jgi:signal transduction histidine kinase